MYAPVPQDRHAHAPPGWSPPHTPDQPPDYYTIPAGDDDSPPSYDDATLSERSPLLVGPPPDYGVYRAYVEPDASSTVSSDREQEETTSLPEWVGQGFVVLCFVGIMYWFWLVINDPYFDGPW